MAEKDVKYNCNTFLLLPAVFTPSKTEACYLLLYSIWPRVNSWKQYTFLLSKQFTWWGLAEGLWLKSYSEVAIKLWPELEVRLQVGLTLVLVNWPQVFTGWSLVINPWPHGSFHRTSLNMVAGFTQRESMRDGVQDGKIVFLKPNLGSGIPSHVLYSTH